MSTDWPEDERAVEMDAEELDLPDSDPETRDAEVHSEEPLALDEAQLRGDDPPE